MSRKRAHAQDLAQVIIDSESTDVASVETWSDYDLYEWLETWGYEWDDREGWSFVEDCEPD